MTVQRVDPSVKADELEMKGEPRGSVRMSVTIGKPEAYSKPNKTKLPEDRNPG